MVSRSTTKSPTTKRRLITVFTFLLLLVGLWVGKWTYHFFPFDKSKMGEKIYTQGITSTGDPLQGRTEGDIEFTDAHFNCAQCHRHSGYGSSEGGNFVMPITSSSLFNPRSYSRTDLFKKLFTESQSKQFWARMRSAYQRPAYTDASLATAIREGVDPSGRKLSPLMPRYKMNDTDMAGLVSYLKKLSSQNDPGVDEQSLYFATVVSKGVNVDDKSAMLLTITKFFEWLNLATKGNLDHPNYSMNYRSDFLKSFRNWEHNTWELSENPDEWPKELAAYYEKKPVFALVGGMVKGDWTPIHKFCEKNRIPCLFPITDLPANEQASHYSIYFNEGLRLEAKTIAQYLSKDNVPTGLGSIVQFYSDEAQGQIPAKVFEQRLNAKKGGLTVSIPVKNQENFRLELSKYLKEHPQTEAIVVWPGTMGESVLPELAAQAGSIKLVFLPSQFVPSDPAKVSSGLTQKLYFSYPYDLPTVYHPHAFRARAWMDTRKLPWINPRIQLNTYYALYLMEYGVEHVVEHFSRDYLIEFLEHEAESSINPGIFPRLSLGPEQRFASKGAYIVQWDSSTEGHLKPLTDWIVP
jgi:Periplasmic binding protein/Cytochrome c